MGKRRQLTEISSEQLSPQELVKRQQYEAVLRQIKASKERARSSD